MFMHNTHIHTPREYFRWTQKEENAFKIESSQEMIKKDFSGTESISERTLEIQARTSLSEEEAKIRMEDPNLFGLTLLFRENKTLSTPWMPAIFDMLMLACTTHMVHTCMFHEQCIPLSTAGSYLHIHSMEVCSTSGSYLNVSSASPYHQKCTSLLNWFGEWK